MLKKTKKQPFFKKNWKQNLYRNRFIRKSLQEKFINSLMVNGEKSKACKFFNSVVYLVRKKIIYTKKTKQNITLLLENHRKLVSINKILRSAKINELIESKSTQQKMENYPKLKVCSFSINMGLDKFLDNITVSRPAHIPLPDFYCNFWIKKPLVRTYLYTIFKKERKLFFPTPNQQRTFSINKETHRLEYLITFSVSKSLSLFLDTIKKKKSPMVGLSLKTFLHLSIENIKPILEVRKVRKAKTTYQVPAIVSKKRQETLAIRWILESAKKRKQNSIFSFAECLAQELVDAFKKVGYARQKREELHKVAESNRAFIRYRWW